jgi:S1-C subfamily serine protease
MEDLNKNQIVLLTLLVSFVTSIATGIMTTSLLQEAPVEVTRNINRIVEKTIETVTTPSVTTSGEKEVTTIIVKEDDMIVSSIDKNVKSVVRINETNSVSQIKTFYGMGLVINKDGLIIADRKTISSLINYSAVLNDGKEVSLLPQGVDKQTDFILFKIIPANNSTIASYGLTPAVLGSGEVKLGQTLASLGGQESNSVSVGRVISLDTKESGTGTSTVKYISSINTDMVSSNLENGSPLFNLSGEIVGIQLSNNSSKSFTPVSVLKKDLSVLQN